MTARAAENRSQARTGRKPGPLAVALSLPPHLDGAACANRWSLFDPQGDHEPATDAAYRHLAALAICRDCPVLAACRRWADTLPPTQRPAGVVAGIATPPAGVSRADVSDNLSLTPAGPGATLSAGSRARREVRSS